MLLLALLEAILSLLNFLFGLLPIPDLLESFNQFLPLSQLFVEVIPQAAGILRGFVGEQVWSVVIASFNLFILQSNFYLAMLGFVFLRGLVKAVSQLTFHSD